MSTEESNINNNIPAASETPASAPADAGSSASAPAEGSKESSPAESAPAFDQNQINDLVGNLVNERLSPYQDDLQLLNQLRGGNKQEGSDPFADPSLADSPELLKTLNDKLSAQDKLIRELTSEKQGRDYQNSLDDFTSNLNGVLSDEETLTAEMTAAIQNSPELTQQYTDAVNGKGRLDANFLNSLKKEIAWRVVQGLNDPNSGILDSLVAKHGRKEELRDNSMISSNQDLSGGKASNDGFSAQVTYDR